MNGVVDQDSLHRTAKYFMDNGRADTHDAAMELLQRFGLSVYVGDQVKHSRQHQIALLSLINVARRTFLAGIEVVGLPNADNLTPLSQESTLNDAVQRMGGVPVDHPHPSWPSAVIGMVSRPRTNNASPCWRLTWEGWRGGVIPVRDATHLADDEAVALVPALAAAVCAAEVFAFHSGDHLMAGRRAAGLSLWQPSNDWLAADLAEPALSLLPSSLWLIGLGNLGQAFAWLLACLPYVDRRQVELVLQDFDRIKSSNVSTSILSFESDIGRRKTRVVSDWLEARGFSTTLIERRFGDWTRRAADEPGIALCGVDNAYGRTALEKPGFDLVVEAGLGAGPHGFRNISVHSFPGSRRAEEIWSKHLGTADGNWEDMPAYQALKHEGLDACGLTRLASRTVGVPFVGVIAGALVIAELLRRLHGGDNLEVASGSAAVLEDFETVKASSKPYMGGYMVVEQPKVPYVSSKP